MLLFRVIWRKSIDKPTTASTNGLFWRAHKQQCVCVCLLQHDLEEQYRKEKQENRTTGEKVKLYSLRMLVNVFVIAVLGGACFLIYWTSIKTLEVKRSIDVCAPLPRNLCFGKDVVLQTSMLS